jgi:zinc protease
MGIFRRSASSLLFVGLLSVGSAALATPPGATRTQPWNSEKSDLKADERIVYGKLANGLRYAIRHNERPQNQVLVRMGIDFGSAAEADDEQGLAHFIEHMAFNGTTNVPEGEMVKMLERLGLKFGADTNASTGYTMTDYRLDLPKADPALIERALFLMRETASEVLFQPEAVDRERGVVIAEMRQRENFEFQRTRAQTELFYPDSFYSKRYPIGKREILESAPAARMQALYRKWYTPDRTRIVVVGPVDVAAVEREIARKFGDWKPNEKPLGEIDDCGFDTSRPAGAAIFEHPEITESISVERMLPDKPRPDTWERSLWQLKMSVASAILGDRLARKSRAEDIPFLGGGVTSAVGFCDKHARVGFVAGGKDGSWRTLLPLMEQQVRQAVQFGFSKTEVEEQLKRLDASFANALANESTAPSSGYANVLTRLDKDIVSSAEQRQLQWLGMRPFLTPDAVHAEFANWFGKLDEPQIFLSTRKADGVTGVALLDAFRASRATPVSAPVERAALAWGYSDFGSAGSVVEDKTIADLGIRTVRFANGVRLNLKKTDFEADRIRWSLRIDGGELLFGKDQMPLSVLMNGAMVGGGLGKHPVDDIRALLAGTTADTTFRAASDSFGGTGAVVGKDLERQLQLLAAFISDPGFREEAVRLFRRPLPEFYERIDSTPGSALGIRSPQIMTGGDRRFSLPEKEALLAADFAGLKAALGDALIRNHLEIGLVGDVDEDQAIKLVAQTLGALPPRSEAPLDLTEQRKAGLYGKPGVYDLPHKGESNQLGWQRVWATTDDADMKQEQTLDLLARAMQIRLIEELREKLGATYGAGAESSMSDAYTGFGTFTLSTNGDPKDLDAIEAAVDAVVAEFVKEPINADLFERARKPVLENYADWRKRNATWLDIVEVAQSRPARLDRFRINERQFRAITRDDLWAAAKLFLENKPAFTFRAIPEEKKAAAQ